ncbi:MAG TPA: crosslink repair DNA glycosylase YcaQ family protein, partial [Solirubrobacteraceae bacterium]|nr:crosslink repair DNA glycosylase YcaQ family protein [Solirubrobacteraceae bacterium]
GLAHAAAPPEPVDLPPAPPRLLPAFDPYLLGWKDRAFAVPPERARTVHPGGGLLRATVVDDGVAIATWSLRAGRVTLSPFDATAPLPDLAAEIADVEGFAP